MKSSVIKFETRPSIDAAALQVTCEKYTEPTLMIKRETVFFSGELERSIISLATLAFTSREICIIALCIMKQRRVQSDGRVAAAAAAAAAAVVAEVLATPVTPFLPSCDDGVA